MSPVWVGSGPAPHLLGWAALILVAIVVIVIAQRRPRIGLILFAAFSARALAAIFHVYVAPLPDGGTDAVIFEKHAWEWGAEGLGAALSNFPGINAYFYSWLMSLVYALTDRSLLLLQSISVLVGVLGVYATWRLAYEVWGEKPAYKVAWLLALFPTVVQYSALPMREAWVVLFFVLGLLGVVRWARRGGVLPIMLGVGAFAIATFFHGGLFVAILGFLGLIASRSVKKWLTGISKGRLRVFASVGLLVTIVLICFYITSSIAIPKLGNPQDLINIERILKRTAYFASMEEATARYPDWTVPSSVGDVFWDVPLRSAYLLFSPFPWDLKSPRHLVGFLDGLFYIGLVFLIWRNLHSIWNDPASRALLIISILLIVVFGMGTGNFGTALRHRGKFVAAFVVLAGPRLPYIIWRSKKTVDRRKTRAIGYVGDSA